MKSLSFLAFLILGASLIAQPATPPDPQAGGRGGRGGGGIGGGAQAVDPDSPVVSFGPTPSVALLVGEKSGGRLAIIDPDTLEIVARIPVGGNFHELATDGRYAYMGTNLPGITVADVREQRRVEPINHDIYGNFHGLTYAGDRLYVGHEQTRLITRWNTATREVDQVLGLPGGSHLMVVTPDQARIFTASSNGQIIAILENQAIIAAQNPQPQDPAAAGRGGRGGRGGGRGGWSYSTFPGDTRMEGMALSPDGTQFWAINMNARTITVIDVPSKQVIATVPYEGTLNNRIKFTQDGRHVLMNQLNDTTLLVWDVATRTVVKEIEIGAGGEGIFMAPDRPHAYYAVSRGNKLSIIDTNTFEVIKEIPDLINPDGMDWYIAK
jgi:DNA-binding beta-propeller fold protein YncE